jgi:hypothetical protein
VQARTRAVLAALGIPVWSQRGRVVQRVPEVLLWRSSTEKVTEHEHASAVQQPVSTQAIHTAVAVSADHRPSMDQVAARPSTLSTRQAQLESLSKMRLGLEQSHGAKPSSATAHVALDSSIERQQVHIAPALSTRPDARSDDGLAVETTTSTPLRFALQARVIGGWVLLVSEDSLQDPAAQRLWDNIGLAMQVNSIERFVWPLAEGARWQQMDGASAALSGFLFRLGASYRVGLMGALADAACPDRVERLPALADLLREPLQKRGFWQLLRANA